MEQASVKATLAREGTEVSISASPERFAGFPIDDGKFWANLVKSVNVKDRMNRRADARSAVSMSVAKETDNEKSWAST